MNTKLAARLIRIARQLLAEDATKRLDAFTSAFLRDLISMSNDTDENGGGPLHEKYNINDIDADALAELEADCAKFQTENAEALAASGLSDSDAAYDFLLSRCKSGMPGFADHGLNDLDKAAAAYGDVSLYVGQGGVLYRG